MIKALGAKKELRILQVNENNALACSNLSKQPGLNEKAIPAVKWEQYVTGNLLSVEQLMPKLEVLLLFFVQCCCCFQFKRVNIDFIITKSQIIFSAFSITSKARSDKRAGEIMHCSSQA